MVARSSYVCASVESCKGILSHENANHNDISFARAHTPAGVSGIVQKFGEHKGTRLKFWGGGENRNDHGKSSNSMPPDGNIIEVFEEVNSEGVDQTYARVPSANNRRGSILQSLPWLIKTAAYTPIVVLSFGTKPVFMVAAVETKVAHAKLRECLISILQSLKCSGKQIT